MHPNVLLVILTILSLIVVVMAWPLWMFIGINLSALGLYVPAAIVAILLYHAHHPALAMICSAITFWQTVAGPIVIGTVLGELGQPAWFRTADDVVAWFGLDPAVFASAGKQAAGLPLTKRGSRYGRRILWLAAQNWCKYTPIGLRFFRHYRFGKRLSYDATVCAFAARLAKLSWAMLRDGTHYDARRAFQAYLPTQIPA